jgi:uncharacterized protein (TIGR03435 family)
MVTRAITLSACVAAALFAQEFEVASIRPSAPGFDNQVKAGVHVDGAQLHCSYLSLKDYIRIAYRMKDYQVIGPDWIASARFDIAAKIPEAAPRDKVLEMLRALLSERFQMKMHRESREFPVYALVAAKSGVKLKESPLDAEPAAASGPGESGPRGSVDVTAAGGPGGVNINFGRGSYFAFGNDRIEGKKLTMESFAESLARFADRPIMDMTGLKGNYDFTLQFTPEDYRAMLIRSAINAGVALPPEARHLMENAPGDSLFTSVQQLGLKLEPRKAPLEVLVVDDIRKMPTEN